MPGGGIVIKQSDEGWWILLMICHHHGDEEPCGADELPVPAFGRGAWFIGGAPDRRSSGLDRLPRRRRFLNLRTAFARAGSCRASVIPSPAWRLTPRTALSCGHDYSARGSTAAIRVARISEASPTNHIVSFRSLSVGDRTLQVQRCSTCRQIQGYTLHTRQNSDGQAIGADPQVIAPALASLLDDAAGKVITLAVSADMDRTLIIPSHHLPVFVVEPDR
jgi:hypothetical protein